MKTPTTDSSLSSRDKGELQGERQAQRDMAAVTGAAAVELLSFVSPGGLRRRPPGVARICLVPECHWRQLRHCTGPVQTPI